MWVTRLFFPDELWISWLDQAFLIKHRKNTSCDSDLNLLTEISDASVSVTLEWYRMAGEKLNFSLTTNEFYSAKTDLDQMGCWDENTIFRVCRSVDYN